MRIFLIIFFISIYFASKAEEISVIELHETKTLDQLVLEQNAQDENINDLNSEINDSEEIDINEDNEIDDEKNESDESSLQDENIYISNFWENVDNCNTRYIILPHK